MNRSKLFIGLAIALVVALLASTFVYHAFQRAANVQPQTTETIVIAAAPLQVGTPLDASNTTTIAWPSANSLPGSFHRAEDCIGRAVINPIVANEPILEANLAPKAAGAGLPATIPQGMRAMSVAVNDVIGVAGFVIPGTMVDVLTTGPLPGKTEGNDNNITRTILENVRVLAAGQKIEQDAQGKPQTVPVVTLLVSPDDAGKLTMAATEGKIQLALRNTIDTKATNPQPVLQAVLFSSPTPIAPVRVAGKVVKPARPSPPPPYVVEIITGAKKETKSFEGESQ